MTDKNYPMEDFCKDKGCPRIKTINNLELKIKIYSDEEAKDKHIERLLTERRLCETKCLYSAVDYANWLNQH